MKLRYSKDRGGEFQDISTQLRTLNIIAPTALEFIASNGVNSLLVGGIVTDASASPIGAVDVDKATGELSRWTSFGTNLPNALIGQLSYNPTADVLAVGTIGRGAWLLYDVTAYFQTATVLRFGLADNDSSPEARFLSNGIYPSRNLEKVGTGTLTIGGTTSYSGSTSVLAGTLMANGDLTSSSGLFVGPAGTLRGTGIVPSTVVSGLLFPGNSIGTLMVKGNLTFNPGSVYQVELTGNAASRVNVAGTASLAGTVQASFSGFARSQTILSAASGLNGTFDGFSAFGLPSFLSGGLGYTTTDVAINLQSSIASTPGLLGNQLGVARALDWAFNAGPGLNSMPALFSLAPGQIPSSLSMLAGDNASVAQSMAISAGSQFTSLLAARTGIRRLNQKQTAVACAASCDPSMGDWSAWASGFGGGQWLNSDRYRRRLCSTDHRRGRLRGDYRLGPHTLVGIAAGLSDSNYSVGATNATGRAGGIHLGFYGLQDWGSFYVNAAVAYSRFDAYSTRYITGIGTSETARASVVANELAGRVEVGRPFDVASLSDSGRFGITPFAALQPTQLWTPGYGETSVTINGAPGVFALGYQPQSTTSLPSFLGAQFELDTEVEGRPFRGWLRAAWKHEFLTSRSVSTGFTVLPGTSFVVDGAPAASDAARFDFGVNYALNNQLAVFANGMAEVSYRGQSLAGTAGIRFVW